MTRAGRRQKQKRKLEIALKRDDPKALLREALRLLRTGEHSRAADIATRAGRAATDDAWKEAARALVVEAMFRGALAGSDDKRLSRLSEAISLDPDQPRLLFHRAIARIRKGEFANAFADLDAVAAADPDRPGLAPLRAFVAVVLGQPTSIDNLEDPERAIVDAVRGIVTIGIAAPDAPEPWQTLSRLSAGKRVDPELLEHHAGLVGRRAAPVLHYYEGIAWIRKGEMSRGYVAIQRAMELGFRLARVTENAMKLLRAVIVSQAKSGNWNSASALVPRTGPTGDRIFDETASTILFHRGLDAARSSRWDLAEEAWSHAHALAGSRALAQNLALAAEALGHWSVAAEAWRQMIRRRPRSPKHPDALIDGQVAALWMHVADCYLKAGGFGDGEDAITCIRKALEFAGEDSALRLSACRRLAELGDEDRALDELEMILGADPDNADALEAIGLMHLERWPRQAIPMLKRLVEIEPNRPGARGALVSAIAQSARGMSVIAPELAEATVFEGLALFPDEPELLFVRGRLLQEEGKEAEAADWYRRTIAVPTEKHDASSAAFHELLHLRSQKSTAHEMHEQLLTDPRSNAGFWLDQATSVMECKLGEAWAGRFLDEAIERSAAPNSPMTRTATILAAFRIVTETEGSEELLARFEKRAEADAVRSGAVEAIRAVRAFRRGDLRGAASKFGLARKLADRAGDASLHREVGFLDAFCANHDIDLAFGEMPVPPELILELMHRFPDGPPTDVRKIPKDLMNELRKYLG